MALHRDIFWVGRQWAVTGSGIQAVDQRRRSEFDIDIARLWDDGLCQRMREHPWFVVEDFEKALAMARARYPAPPRKTAPPDMPISRPAKPAPARATLGQFWRQWLHPSRRLVAQAPQDEVVTSRTRFDPHGEERVFARLEP
jgi:hypothetical protein